MRYRALRATVMRMMEQVRRGGWGETVEPGGLAPGAVSANVATLRKRLMAMGDLAVEPDLSGVAAEADIAPYDERLMGAVAAFQQRHGLTADGIAGPATLRALNAPLGKRLAQAMLNLERLRWRQGRLHGRRIEVNQADFRMVVYDDANAPVHDARVVVGKQERRLQTPEFYDMMSYIVLNPTWTVPRSIIRREFLPEMQKDVTFFEKNNMLLLRGGRKVDPLTIDWATETRESVSDMTVIQRPGKGNALGNVKFMFPNGYNIYLHDTPSKHLFARDSRAFSHGCVRVERPFALAWLLLSEQTEDPGRMIEDTLAHGKETNVPLDRPIPINLMYLTSWVDEAGILNFREDVYKRDEILARALRANS
jgi:murein L,D-transpeptidase YcbB/YkuD